MTRPAHPAHVAAIAALALALATGCYTTPDYVDSSSGPRELHVELIADAEAHWEDMLGPRRKYVVLIVDGLDEWGEYGRCRWRSTGLDEEWSISIFARVIANDFGGYESDTYARAFRHTFLHEMVHVHTACNDKHLDERGAIFSERTSRRTAGWLDDATIEYVKRNSR